ATPPAQLASTGGHPRASRRGLLHHAETDAADRDRHDARRLVGCPTGHRDNVSIPNDPARVRRVSRDDGYPEFTRRPRKLCPATVSTVSGAYEAPSAG